MYDPLYSKNLGLCGFRCRATDSNGKPCNKVVRTYKGILMHCKRVHGLEAQMKFPDFLTVDNYHEKMQEVLSDVAAKVEERANEETPRESAESVRSAADESADTRESNRSLRT